MLENYGKIFAIILFAIVIYLVGHTAIWLLGSFAIMDWLIYLPFTESYGSQAFGRIIMSSWAIVSIVLSIIFTK